MSIIITASAFFVMGFITHRFQIGFRKNSVKNIGRTYRQLALEIRAERGL